MSTPYRFAGAEVWPADRLVLLEGKPVAIGGRAFDVLLALLGRPGKLVSKNELLDLAWPGVVVEENNLQVQVSTLRKLFGPQSITTVPGRGYRFALPVDGAPQVSAAPTAPAAHSPPMTNLPDELPPLYGRAVEVGEVVRLLEQRRLVSIVGAGGIGKTRVAQAVAHRLRVHFNDGVWLIELAALSDPKKVASTVAQTLNIPVGDEANAIESVTGAVRGRAMLLVLDNCEHVLETVAALATAVRRAAPGVTLLATSQQPLKVADEYVHRLGTLAVPPTDMDCAMEDALDYGAVALFVAHAQAADRHFVLNARNATAVFDTCRRLDGIALALELAAARVPLLGVEGVHARLGERFKLLAGGTRDAMPRHQTLHAALEWSHGLLSDEERRVFRRLGIFAGGFSLEAAQEVARDASLDAWEVLDHLGGLVDKSLATVDASDPPRYRLLETTRAYALERLAEATETESIARRHAQAFSALFETSVAERWLASPVAHFARYRQDLDNLRAALEWSSRNDHELEIAIAGAAAWLWLGSGLDAEGIAACERAISHLNKKSAPALEARALSELAQLGWYVLPLDRALQVLERAIALYRDTKDSVGLYLALARKAGFLASCGEIESARHALAESESLETDDWPGRLRLERLIAKTRVIWFDGTLEEFQAAHDERYQLACLAGNERDRLLARGNLFLAKVAFGQLDDAICDGLVLVEQFRRHCIGGAYLGYLLAFLAMALAQRGRLNEAIQVLREAAPALRAGAMVWRLLDLFALVALLRGRTEHAARVFGAGAAIFEKVGRKRETGLNTLHDIVSERLHDALPTEVLARLLVEGEAMSEREAVVVALQELAYGD